MRLMGGARILWPAVTGRIYLFIFANDPAVIVSIHFKSRDTSKEQGLDIYKFISRQRLKSCIRTWGGAWDGNSLTVKLVLYIIFLASSPLIGLTTNKLCEASEDKPHLIQR